MFDWQAFNVMMIRAEFNDTLKYASPFEINFWHDENHIEFDDHIFHISSKKTFSICFI